MPRNNHRSKQSRKRYVVTYTPSEYSADYNVFMTNGSGIKKIVVTGSRVSAWNRAIRIGLEQNDETMPGVWWPIDIKYVRENDSMFSAV